MPEIVGVPAEKIEAIWPLVLPTLALHPSDYFSADDLKWALLERDCQLWLALEGKEFLGAVVTEIIVYPQNKVLTVRLVAGRKVRKWAIPMRDVVYSFGKWQGCSRLEAMVRPGWVRLLGMKQVAVVARAEL